MYDPTKQLGSEVFDDEVARKPARLIWAAAALAVVGLACAMLALAGGV